MPIAGSRPKRYRGDSYATAPSEGHVPTLDIPDDFRAVTGVLIFRLPNAWKVWMGHKWQTYNSDDWRATFTAPPPACRVHHHTIIPHLVLLRGAVMSMEITASEMEKAQAALHPAMALA